MNRLYAVEGLMTQTGINADHRLRVAPSTVLAIAAALAEKIASTAEVQALAKRFPLPSGVKPEWVAECASDLAANKGASLVLAGYRQPPAVHLIANLLNAALQNVGQTVVYHPSPAPPAAGIAELADALNKGQADTLIILGSNPAYTASANLNWPETQKKAKTVIRLGYYEDETFEGSTWHLPAAHYLESWGDARTSDGTLVSIQPLLEPLFGGVTEYEVLARLGVFGRSARMTSCVRRSKRSWAPTPSKRSGRDFSTMAFCRELPRLRRVPCNSRPKTWRNSSAKRSCFRHRARTSLKSSFTVTTAWTTGTTPTMAGFRRCPTRSPDRAGKTSS